MKAEPYSSLQTHRTNVNIKFFQIISKPHIRKITFDFVYFDYNIVTVYLYTLVNGDIILRIQYNYIVNRAY